ncbi:MAG: glycosyltransferase family 4 protein [Meiothermus sp.]|nr:glycosyltransferase family 4 protein [Meiothermus sp.]
MRFLFLTQYFPPEIGASQVRIAATVRELTKLGHEVEVVTAVPNHLQGKIFPEYKGVFYKTETWEGCKVHRVWMYPAMGAGLKRMIGYGSFVLTSLIGLLRSQRPDFIFVDSPPLFLSFPGWLASKWFGAPMIFNVADLWPDSVRELGLMKEGPLLRWAEWLERWSYRHSRYVNAVTEGIHKVLLEKKNLSPEKVLYLPNGVDTRVFRPKEPDLALARELGLEGKKVILYAGTHGYAHGIEFALQAAQRLRDPSVELVFIGDGSEKPKLVQMAQEMNLANVRFLPPAQPDYIARLFSFSLAGLSTLRDSPLFEGTRPAKIFATMSSGKPVLYSGKGEGARLVQQIGAGLVVPPEDVQGIADMIERAAADPQAAARMGQSGRHHIETHYSWGALVGQWLRQLEGRLEAEISPAPEMVSSKKSVTKLL